MNIIANYQHDRAGLQRLADEYLDAADAPATVRTYTADWQHFAS